MVGVVNSCNLSSSNQTIVENEYDGWLGQEKKQQTYLNSFRVVVKFQLISGSNLLGLYHRLEVSEEPHVLRHVSGQYLESGILIHTLSFNSEQ